MVLEFRNPLSLISLENWFPSREIIKQSRFNVSVRNVEISKSSSGSYRYLTHTTDKAMINERQGMKFKNCCSRV